MSCNWCHESTPPNRKDGFCSDICQIATLKTEIERLKVDNDTLRKIANDEAEISCELLVLLKVARYWVPSYAIEKMAQVDATVTKLEAK